MGAHVLLDGLRVDAGELYGDGGIFPEIFRSLALELFGAPGPTNFKACILGGSGFNGCTGTFIDNQGNPHQQPGPGEP